MSNLFVFSMPLDMKHTFITEKISDSFERLVPDVTSVDRFGTSMQYQRERRFAKFTVLNTSNKFEMLYENKTYEFSQNVDDFRNMSRRFEPIEPSVRNSEFIKTFINMVTTWASQSTLRPLLFSSISVSVHQVRQIATSYSFSDNSPEGIHRDGSDFIVSALVVSRHNILGGKSIVYAPDRRKIVLNHTLKSGEGLFHEDRMLWHDVTKVWSTTKGCRDIFGIDIHFEK